MCVRTNVSTNAHTTHLEVARLPVAGFAQHEAERGFGGRLAALGILTQRQARALVTGAPGAVHTQMGCEGAIGFLLGNFLRLEERLEQVLGLASLRL